MIESVQYNAALALTDTVRGSSREQFHQELGFMIFVGTKISVSLKDFAQFLFILHNRICTC